VSPQQLLRNAERVMVDLVNVIGVSINAALRKPHLRNALQFVAGLGPRECLPSAAAGVRCWPPDAVLVCVCVSACAGKVMQMIQSFAAGNILILGRDIIHTEGAGHNSDHSDSDDDDGYEREQSRVRKSSRRLCVRVILLSAHVVPCGAFVWCCRV
jgi:hypothetical protein